MNLSRRASLIGGFGFAMATLWLMIATESRLAIVWDEGYTLGREQRIRSWLLALRDPGTFAATWRPPSPSEELVQQIGPPPPRPDQIDSRSKLLGPRAIEWFWPFAREEPHGHPPFYALVGLVGDVLAPTWALLPRARLGPMLTFGVTAGAIFAFLARRRGVWAGVGAAAACVVEKLRSKGKLIVIAALAEGAVSIAVMMPVPLSYYSPLVGGLPGAARLGMEPTYYWDALSDDAIEWLNHHTDPGETILFPTYTSSFRYLRQSG